ncbi:MAG: GTP pyrophosphokinase [Nodosilinea sp. WJT8-NPBG4]|jgi:(p)ppGpp synthase/HD superfamily hydrolase|nr:GTP pyrophosphokinase [Nodosilinea sp. WJT8-NPBG4]
MTDLDVAIEMASNAHKGQLDKAGKDYIEHPLRVLDTVKTKYPDDIELQCIAVMHDVIEDSDVTLEDIKAAGFSDRVIAGLKAMTKVIGIDYDAYITRVIGFNPDAIKVKLADLEDNMDLSRLPNVTEKDIKRNRKYAIAKQDLLDIQSGAFVP